MEKKSQKLINECCAAKNRQHTWVRLCELDADEPCRMFIFYKAWCSSCGSIGTEMHSSCHVDEEPTITKFWKAKNVKM